MPQISVPLGTIDHRVVGPTESAYPPVVFVHGALVNGRLWEPVAERLGAAGYRCHMPTLPLGAHTTPVVDRERLSARGVVDAINDYLDALGLTDVTLVGNDSGGALCQMLVHRDHSRIGRLVLTNCDTFDQFPPFPFNVLFALARGSKSIAAVLAATRSTAIRRSVLGFGLLMNDPDPDLTREWVEPCLTRDAIRRDTAAVLRTFHGAELNVASEAMREFPKPLTLVWGQDDRCFKPANARRLHSIAPASTLVEVPDATTFVSIDRPEAVVDAIVDISA